MILYGFKTRSRGGVPKAFKLRSVSFPIQRTRVTRVTRDDLPSIQDHRVLILSPVIPKVETWSWAGVQMVKIIFTVYNVFSKCGECRMILLDK